MRQQGINGLRGVHAGSCHAWPLPADATCATVARQVFRDAVSEVGLEPDLLDDCILMASELAANTLHARAVARTGGGGDRFVSVAPDMGGEPIPSAGPVPQTRRPAYPAGPRRSVDGRPARLPRTLALPARPRHPPRARLQGLRLLPRLAARLGAVRGPGAAQAVAGRGLQIVHELSRGRWGHHPTRARLGGWGLRGKAVWFAVPAPLAHARLVDVTGLHAYTLSADVTATTRASERLSARQAARELEAMLDERGFGGRLVRADQPASDMSVLSVCRGLTVWCRSGVVSLTSPEGDRERWGYADLVEAAEQTVRRYEELELGLDLAAAGGARTPLSVPWPRPPARRCPA